MPAASAAAPYVTAQDTQRGPAMAALFAAFIFSGAATVLLGCILPALATQWRLGDEGLGRLLLALFAGSACGALLVRRSLDSSIVGGLTLTGGSALALAFWPAEGLILFFCYGAGLGCSMTATSLLVGRLYQASNPESSLAQGGSGVALTLLNFFWSLGATLCPLAAHAALAHGSLRQVFLAVAALAGVLLVVVARALGVFEARRSSLQDAAHTENAATAGPFLLAFFALFAMLYVGVESSLGGWVVSYVQRMPVAHALSASAAASFFWLALLGGRALAPALLLRVRERRLLAAALVLAALGVVLLLTAASVNGVLLGAALAGFGLAPVFPLCVSQFLALSGQSPRTRWLFALSGAGGALLPWLTGHVSAGTGSLHAGLLIPLAAVVAMLAMLRLGPVVAADRQAMEGQDEEQSKERVPSAFPLPL